MPTKPAQIAGYPECDWPLDTSCLSDEWAGYEDALQNRAKSLAISTLRRLTGYRVGGCAVTVRPCSTTCAATQGFDWYGSTFQPMLYGGSWINCGCFDNCAGHLTLKLPKPIGVVYTVKIDGSAFTNYYIGNGGLIRTDGQKWPATQDLTKPDTQSGTFSVTYLNAWPVDAVGSYALAVLAMEFANACGGKGKCRLPSTVTSVVRQGVSFEIAAGSFPNGLTGLKDVDAYIALWNPGNLRERPTIVVPNQRGPQVLR